MAVDDSGVSGELSEGEEATLGRERKSRESSG